MVFFLCDVPFNRNIGFEKGNSVIHQTYHSKQMLLVNARHFNWMLQFGEWTEFILKIYMIWSVLYKQSAWIFVPIERIERSPKKFGDFSKWIYNEKIKNLQSLEIVCFSIRSSWFGLLSICKSILYSSISISLSFFYPFQIYM